MTSPWPPVAGPAIAIASGAVVGGWSLAELLDRDGLPWWAYAGLAASIAVVAVYVFAQPKLIAVARSVQR
jgi:hypothetical protein